MAPERTDLRELARRHLAELDARLAENARARERVARGPSSRRLRQGHLAGDTELPTSVVDRPPSPTAVRRLTLLVYRDLEAAQRYLVDVFGFAPGTLTRDDDAHRGARRGVRRATESIDGCTGTCRGVPGSRRPPRPAPPRTAWRLTSTTIEAHFERSRAAGAEIVNEPTDMPYGVREYDARDLEGGLWSFMQPMEQNEEEDE